jgi:hypothetical protein
MFEEMTAEQAMGWWRYYCNEPFGAEQDAIQTGIVASTICNVNRGKDTPPFNHRDFMLSCYKDQSDKESEEAKAKEKLSQQEADELAAQAALMAFATKVNKGK